MTDPYHTQHFEPLPLTDGGSYIVRYSGYAKDGSFMQGLKQFASMKEVMKFQSTTHVTRMDIEFVSGT